MLFSKLVALLSATLVLASSKPRSVQKLNIIRDTDGLQTNVTWDEYSLMINGERMFMFSGEVHPYRMPSQSLYLDILQKVKSMGFNTVSFYVFWGIVEPKRGVISFEGFRDLQPFFDAAMEAGIYLMARPGPYINAETTAGGFPGWGTYTPSLWRTSNTTYYEAWQNYVSTTAHILAENQITNGGPIILVQSENEYTGWAPGYSEDFTYEAELLSAWRTAGIKVPITFNDASPEGHYLTVNIWGYDSYPNGFDCSSPYTWASNAVPTYFWSAHEEYAPEEPNAVYEYQGGAFDGWGGSGYDTCAILTGPDFERGSNLHVEGSAIAEDRTLREKYYELKLQANFLRVSPAYLTTRPMNSYSNQGAFTGNQALLTTQVLDVVGNQTGFYVIRQANASSNAMEMYTLTLPTSVGNLTVPVLGGQLTLDGKDSKVHVVDYAAGANTLLYSTAEITTWATIDGRDIIVVYGNAGELHETAFKFDGTVPAATVVSGSEQLKSETINSTNLVIQYTTTGQTVVEVGSDVLLYILDRANAYEFWVLYPPTTGAYANYSTADPILVKGGYFIRSVDVSGSTLALLGDLNSTASFEIIAPAASSAQVTFNGEPLTLEKTSYGTLTAEKTVSLPQVNIPTLESLTWKTADSLPEITPTYDDSSWTTANHTTTVNPTQPSTPVVLYAGDYGYHTGNILWRAHFTSLGAETGFTLNVQGGSAFGYSVWLDSSFIGSWVGDAVYESYQSSFSFPGTLSKGSAHVLTILQDHMGYEEDWTAASDDFKAPRGLLSYSFEGSNATTVDLWKVIGNLGGEDYVDTTRGPLNEGGLYGERQGWHLPDFDDSYWADGLPTNGISSAGVSFYRTTFELDIPSGVDYPMAIVTTNMTTNPYFRSQFYVNGYQFGKYVNSVGPQQAFPVPQGILNYNGLNTLAVSLWAHENEGAKLSSIALEVLAQVESSMAAVVNQPMPPWTPRPGAS
ncbi:glycoside hydrolase family 35 protein [Serpula lacrymans var. lacrymans S7.9]|uniref:Beta-galactosidase n=1 Tax=Serpula lacrymans var. lacrymans (strain S7.9) TaxID=578457 RepID=F8NT20_SERL9|nr:glycoside hydrolase family 35 protein [Serpula lacrymans var. lacrymans S7.9]EGO25493.1 glycoside hydrolase family 35 protein [Serpula lacrymans var. lacrymans S7.9]